jgi:AP-2 complex subunit alpha
MAIRGLTIFISDIRNCSSREEEAKIVDKEMAKIRKKFKDAPKLTPYEKKKYVWKMLYMFVLGYPIDFGHMEAINLISSEGWSEKQVGYLAVALLLNENHDFLRLIINSVSKDLLSKNEDIQTLSLNCIANIGGREFAEALTGQISKIFVGAQTRAPIKKKTALSLLRMYRKSPDFLQVGEVRDRIFALLDDRSLGVITSVCSLMLGLVAASAEGWESGPSALIKALGKVTSANAAREYGSDYAYYSVMCPWVQIKLLRLLQYFPKPDDAELLQKLNDVLERILSDSQVVKNVNRNNAVHAVLFEAVSCAVTLELGPDMNTLCVSALGRFISSKESNYRYLALDSMQRMCGVGGTTSAIQEHQATVIEALRDKDVSIRRRALDLLYEMCDSRNCKEIVAELISYLEGSDVTIREELVLRVAILSEKFAVDLSWYVDIILQLIQLAGDQVSDDIWFRVVQIVTNHPNLQKYAAETVFKALSKEPVHENMVKVAGYILGEFGHLIESNAESKPAMQFDRLNARFAFSSLPTKAILLSSFIKLINLFPELKGRIAPVFASLSTTLDSELQQRAVEYNSLARGRSNVLEAVMEQMPAYQERQSKLLQRLTAQDDSAADKTVRAVKKQSEVSDGSSPVPSKVNSPTVRAPAASGGGDLFGLDDVPAPAATVVRSSAPVGGGSMLDDLMGGGPSAPAPGATVVKPSGGSLMDDLLGSFGGGGNVGMSVGGGMDLLSGGMGSMDLMGGSGSGAEPRQADAEDVKKWQQALMLTNDGLLYVDDYLTIAARMQFKGPQGQLTLLFTNKQSAPLEKFVTIIQQAPFFQYQGQPVPNLVSPHGQVTQVIMCMLTEPFMEAPKFRVQFACKVCSFIYTHVTPPHLLNFFQGKPITLELKVPIGATKVMAPVPLESGPFFGAWKQVGLSACACSCYFFAAVMFQFHELWKSHSLSSSARLLWSACRCSKPLGPCRMSPP